MIMCRRPGSCVIMFLPISAIMRVLISSFVPCPPPSRAPPAGILLELPQCLPQRRGYPVVVQIPQDPHPNILFDGLGAKALGGPLHGVKDITDFLVAPGPVLRRKAVKGTYPYAALPQMTQGVSDHLSPLSVPQRGGKVPLLGPP